MVSERQVRIINKKGLHVRPAAAFAQAAAKFKCAISVVKDGRAFNAKSSLDLLMLAAVPGTVLMIRADGEDAERATATLAAFVENRFGMDEED